MVAVRPLVQKTGKILDVIGLREVKDDCLCVTAGPGKRGERRYLAVIRVDPVNFSLMSEREQEVLLESYRVLLNRLAPDDEMSIHMRILPYDLHPYLDHLQDDDDHLVSSSPLFREMAADHKAFVLSLASRHTLLQREFYIRISAHTKDAVRGARKRLKPSELFDHAKTDLSQQCQALLEDLQRGGVTAHRLESEELVSYYLSCLHYHRFEHQPLNRDALYSVDFPTRSFHPSSQQTSSSHSPIHRALVPQLQSSDDGVDSGSVEDYHVAAAASALSLSLSASPSEKKKLRRSARSARPWWVWKSSKHAKRQARRDSRHQEARQEPVPYSMLVSLPELIQPSLVEQTPHWIRVTHEHDEYMRARAVTGYPAYLVAGWLERLLQVEEPYTDIVLYIQTLHPKAYTSSLSQRLTSYSSTLRLAEKHGLTEDPYIKSAYETVSQLRDEIVQQVENVHSVSLYVMTRATSLNELRIRDDTLESLLQSLGLESVSTTLEHLQAWMSMLPDGHDVLKRRRVLDTSSVVMGFPFASSSLSTEPGSLVGLMPNGSLVIMNPMSSQLENGHEITFARSGAGKSYYHKVSVMRSLLFGFEAIIIDPEVAEWEALCQRFGGSYIRLSPSGLKINPFDLVPIATGDSNVMVEKLENLLALFDILLHDAGPGVLPQKEKAFLRKCLVQVYSDRGIDKDDSSSFQRPAPNMREMYEIISTEKCGPDVYGLADRLLRYVSSFPEQTEVALDHRLIVFNVFGLKNEWRAVGMFLVTDFVWTQIRRERIPRRRLLTIDEAWTMMEFPEGGQFIASLSRQARKYNLSLRVITQDVDDFLASKAGRVVVLNSAQKFLMKQDSTTVDAVVNAFKLSPAERSFLLSAAKGEGLFFARNSHVPLRVVASQIEHDIANTNQEELQQRENEQLLHDAEQEALHDHDAVAIQRSKDVYSVIFPRFFESQQQGEGSEHR